MPIITRLFPHLIQPQYPVRVDQGNPLTKGLQDVAVLGNTLRWNAARNTFLSSNGTVNSDPRGPIITTDATAYSVPGGYAVPPITVVVGFIRLGAPTSGNHALWISKDDITGNGGLYFRYEDAGTLAVLKSQTAVVGSGAFTVKPGGSLLAVTVDSGNFALYGDGGLVASGTHAQTFTSATPAIGSESSEAAENHPNGIFYFHAVWDRVLSAAEFKRLSDNPWQIFEPRKQEIYVSVASGGTTLITASDSLTPSFTEALALLSASAISDTLTSSVSESVGLAVLVAASDTVTPSVAETASVIAAVIASDTLTPTLVEAQASFVSSALSEAFTLSLGEAQASLLSSAVTDIAAVSVTESAAVLVALVGSDTYIVSITDTAAVTTADIIAKAVSETFSISFTEAASIVTASLWTDKSVSVTVWTDKPDASTTWTVQ